MKTKVQKWGNSLALRIPKPFALEINLEDNSDVNVSLQGGKIVIEPVQKEFLLEDLVKGITKNNRHTETDWGKPQGKETW
jgi:antitoxin MazE